MKCAEQCGQATVRPTFSMSAETALAQTGQSSSNAMTTDYNRVPTEQVQAMVGAWMIGRRSRVLAMRRIELLAKHCNDDAAAAARTTAASRCGRTAGRRCGPDQGIHDRLNDPERIEHAGRSVQPEWDDD